MGRIKNEVTINILQNWSDPIHIPPGSDADIIPGILPNRTSDSLLGGLQSLSPGYLMSSAQGGDGRV